MILKLTIGELKALKEYSYHPSSFGRFMEQIYFRIDDDTGEVDLDMEDFKRIESYERRGHKKRIAQSLKRPMDEMYRRFFGR